MILGGGALSHSMAVEHFGRLHGVLAQLGLQEATNKATAPATSMIWLGLLFDTEAMTVTLPPAKLQEILELVTAWTSRHNTTLHDLQVLIGKFLYVAQVCSLALLFLNRMLETLHACSPSGTTPLPLPFTRICTGSTGSSRLQMAS